MFENANIHFSFYVDKNRHTAEATVKQKGLTPRAKEETRDLYLTVDNVLGKVEKQLRKHKSRTRKIYQQKKLEETFQTKTEFMFLLRNIYVTSPK